MTHLSENKLLEYALELIDNSDERDAIDTHLENCPQCMALLNNIKADVEIIGDVQPYRTIIQMPNPKRQSLNVYSLLKFAALFIIGIFVGFGASRWTDRKPAPVSPSYVTLAAQQDSLPELRRFRRHRYIGSVL